MFYVDFRRRDEGTAVPDRRDVQAGIEARGYFGIEAIDTDDAEVRLLIRCGTESRALDLARDFQREVLYDEEWSAWDLEVSPVVGSG